MASLVIMPPSTPRVEIVYKGRRASVYGLLSFHLNPLHGLSTRDEHYYNSERRQPRAQLRDLQDPDREQKFTNSLFANDGTI